ncbi:MAG: hypothetical protein AAF901_12730 [Bacteroidota bacterium]
MKSNRKYRFIGVIILILLAVGCREDYNSIYGFDTNDCKLKKEINNETHFIYFSCSSWDVQIDYGFGVYSPLETHSSEDYLRKEKWKLNAIPELSFDQQQGVQINEIMDSIQALSIDDSLNAKLSYLGENFNFKITIPNEIVNLVELREKNGNISSRLIYDKSTMKSFQYYLINDDNIQNGAPEAISINLKSKQVLSLEEVSDLFANVRLPS